MGLHTKLYVPVLVLWLVLSELVKSCPHSCEGTNSKMNGTEECPYKVKLKENSTLETLMPCCDFRKPSYSNTTYNKLTVLFPVNTKRCFLNMNYPLLMVDDVVIRDNNLTLIQINVSNQHVKTIDMSSNKLNVIKKGIFDRFKNIKELNLRNNNIENIEEESFTGLTKLESIDLSENEINVLNNFLEPLKNLQKVNLSRNNIEMISENYFNNPQLQTLDLSHNNLKRVDPGALRLLPNLVQLLLTDNIGIGQRYAQLLVGSSRRLQLIDASRTGLDFVPEAFTQSVRCLTLDGNTITSVRGGDFDSYPLLQSLELTNNKIDFVEDDSMGRLEMLLFLNFNYNKLTAVPTALTEELKYLSINNNLINNLTEVDLKNLPNLEVLFLQYNKILYIEEHTFRNLLALKVLDLSYNPIKTLSTSSFDGPLLLRDLRLCYINVTVPEKDASFPTSSPESIQMLHLQSSPSLARQVLADSAAIAAFSSLQYLDLRMNNLSEIRNDLLLHIWQLKTLRLHGNRLNCKNEDWLKEWLNWNGSMANGETCYYATSAPMKEVEYKYNVSFSASNLIRDKFSPVNIFSADEMINELQKYYGYYENKTDKAKLKDSTNKFNDSDNLSVPRKISTKFTTANLIPDRKDVKFAKIETNDIQTKAERIAKILDQKKHATDSNKIELVRKQVSLPSNLNSTNNEETTKYKNKPRLGRRLNTPVNLTIIPTKENTKKPSKQTNSTENKVTTLNTKTLGKENLKAIESLPYQSENGHFFRYIGSAFITILSMFSIVFWVILLMKQRKRRRIIQEPEQIEIPNISGGVAAWGFAKDTSSSVKYDTLVA